MNFMSRRAILFFQFSMASSTSGTDQPCRLLYDQANCRLCLAQADSGAAIQPKNDLEREPAALIGQSLRHNDAPIFCMAFVHKVKKYRGQSHRSGRGGRGMCVLFFVEGG